MTVNPFCRLALRIHGMEGIIENIVSKIDTVLIKLESMERSKTKRRANAARILDVFTDGEIIFLKG
jgi:hypothetical protein